MAMVTRVDTYCLINGVAFQRGLYWFSVKIPIKSDKLLKCIQKIAEIDKAYLAVSTRGMQFFISQT